jgi:hypothetical protein
VEIQKSTLQVATKGMYWDGELEEEEKSSSMPKFYLQLFSEGRAHMVIRDRT